MSYPRRIGFPALILTLAVGTPARSDIIHAAAWVQGSGTFYGSPFNPVHFEDSFGGHTSGGTSAAAGGATDVSHMNVTAQATVDLSPGGAIHLESHSYASTLDGVGNAGSSAAAQWVDVIRLDSHSPPPNSLRLTFHVDGSFYHLPDANSWRSSARGRVDVVTSEPFWGIDTSPVFPDFSYYGRFASTVAVLRDTDFNEAGKLEIMPVQLIYGKVDHLTTTATTADSSNYAWDVYMDAGYNPLLSGYELDLMAFASSSSYEGAFASANFSQTIRLAAVTLGNGDPLPGPISFDSGFSMGSVPEPSSVVMLGLGAFGLAIRGRRRWGRSRA